MVKLRYFLLIQLDCFWEYETYNEYRLGSEE